MRFAAALLISACCVHLLYADEPETSAATETVHFDGEVLGLAFEGDDPNATIKEYLPAGETLDSWTRLAAIRQFSHIEDPAAYAAATLKQLKENYPQSPSAVVEDPDSGAVVLDFVVWPEDASFVEFNVFRYEKRSGGGLISQQYALRAYGENSEPFLKDLRSLRERLVEKMAGEGLQVEATTALREGSR